MSPHSWELLKLQENSCLIGILRPPGGVSLDWASAFSNLQKPNICDLMPVSGMPFGEARTMIANEALNRGFSWVFYLDADIVVPPETIPQLMSHRLPIVSALYHQRFPTWTGSEAVYRPVMFRIIEGKSEHIIDFKPGSLVEANFIGAGCLLVNRSVFERFLAHGIKRFFEWTLHADSPDGKGLSEDFYFTQRATELGYKCMVDTSLIAVHETTAKVTTRGLEPKL